MKKKGTDPYTFFQSNCLTFVGGIPRTFHKSMDGMKNALSFEKNLYVQAIKKGLSKEKFYADVLKRISKLDGIERLLEYQRLMGVSDD